MTDYTELVKALRSASAVSTAWEKLMLDAATAIEDMAKHITEMHERVTVLQIARGELEAEVKRIEPKRGEWELIDGAEPMRWGCSRCKYMSWETSNYCPRCGAKMEVQDER